MSASQLTDAHPSSAGRMEDNAIGDHRETDSEHAQKVHQLPETLGRLTGTELRARRIYDLVFISVHLST